MIASNLPDIDVLIFATGTPSVAFRRGWTHGVLADLLLRGLAEQTRNKARSCHQPPGDRLCGGGRTMAVLLPG